VAQRKRLVGTRGRRSLTSAWLTAICSRAAMRNAAGTYAKSLTLLARRCRGQRTENRGGTLPCERDMRDAVMLRRQHSREAGSACRRDAPAAASILCRQAQEDIPERFAVSRSHALPMPRLTVF